MARAYVSIGSNVDPESNVRRAVAALRAHYGELRLSPVYQTPAEGFVGADFYNLVAAFATDETPAAVAATLSTIEQQQGRVRHGDGLHARTLDLDLLLYDELVVTGPGLTLPREDILRYAFVLKPLADIAPMERHPVDGRCYRELWQERSRQAPKLRAIALVPPL